MITACDCKLIRKYDNETVCIEPWGENALRVRVTCNAEFTGNEWALLDLPAKLISQVTIKHDKDESTLTNGKITAAVKDTGVIAFTNQKGEVLLKEHWERLSDKPSKALFTLGRSFRAISGDSFKITQRFCSNDNEKIFGMGQYQHNYFDHKGCSLELAQRNSQVTVPFYISNLGYGFLWNNPAIGKVIFGKNGTEWVSESSKQIDYWITAGDNPNEIEQTYMNAVGKAPVMPDFAMGFWQCKLRYRTQDELMAVARKHKSLGLPIDVIVADFFHWTQQGEYKFDPEDWPDVEGMCKELKEMNIKLMVSVWPTVDFRSENFKEMFENGFLARVERGLRVNMFILGNQLFFDPTHPGAREYVWQKCKENYWDKGVSLFWLDVAEPEYNDYDFGNFRYHIGSNLEVGNIYPVLYSKTFYDGMKSEGIENPLNLVRSAWAGSARYGALLWSGDIDCTFESFRRQIKAGLSVILAGIPWWTTDIGGFHGADINDPDFKELLLRWFAYAVFCPVFRLHGYRLPFGEVGPDEIGSGADNEVWSYGEEAFEIMKKYLFMRERLRPYITEQMNLTAETGTPVMRPLFYDFPEDAATWDIDDTYMFGPDILVAPVTEKNTACRNVYLPADHSWKDAWTGKEHSGGNYINVNAPIDIIPVFLKDGANINIIGV